MQFTGHITSYKASIVFSCLLFAFLIVAIPALAEDEEQNKTAQEPESKDIPTEDTKPKAANAEPEMPAFDDEVKWDELPIAKLQGLNKVTAKTSEIIIKIGEKTKFGNLDFTVSKCLKKPASEKNENVALLEIWDKIPGQTRNLSFQGWMFSSSPAISALEHPIYDVILLECMKTIPAKTAEKKEPTAEVKK